MAHNTHTPQPSKRLLEGHSVDSVGVAFALLGICGYTKSAVDIIPVESEG